MLKDILLGTAQWGWTTDKDVAFQLLDSFYADGFRQVDTATNYPINGIPKDFRRAENILAEWLLAHGIRDMKVMVKIGSLVNLRSPDCNLTKSFLLMALEQYSYLFHENLETLMIHWDNRYVLDEIEDTFEALEVFAAHGLQVGISGIKHPDLYFAVNETYNFDFYIQVKHNILHSDYKRYQLFHQKSRFIAYGINAGGIKLNALSYDEKSVLAARGGDLSNEDPVLKKLPLILAEINSDSNRPAITDFYQLGMAYASTNRDVERIIVAPSSVEQWSKTVNFYRVLQQFDYQNILQSIHV